MVNPVKLILTRSVENLKIYRLKFLRVNLMKIRVYRVLSAMSKVTQISITNIEKPGRNLVQYTKTGHTIDMILRPSADQDRTLV